VYLSFLAVNVARDLFNKIQWQRQYSMNYGLFVPWTTGIRTIRAVFFYQHLL